jgi:hypothetical protein
MREQLRREITRLAKASGRNMSDELNRIIEQGLRAEETERGFAAIKEQIYSLSETVQKSNEGMGVMKEIDRLQRERRAVGGIALTDEERALWRRLEELSGASGLLGERERMEAERIEYEGMTPEERAQKVYEQLKVQIAEREPTPEE